MTPRKKTSPIIVLCLLFLALSLIVLQLLADTPAAESPSSISSFMPTYILRQQTDKNYNVEVDGISGPAQNRVYLKEGGEITVINARTGITLATISSVSMPDKMVLSHDGSRLFVSSIVPFGEDGQITVFDTATFEVVAVHAYPFIPTVSYKQDVRAMAVDSNNILYLIPARLGGNPYTVDLMDGNTGQMLTSVTVGTASINHRIAATDARLYVSRGAYSQHSHHLWQYDLYGGQPKLMADIPLTMTPENLLATPNDAFLLIRYQQNGDIVQLDAQTLEEIRTYVSPSGRYHSMALSADGQHLHAHYQPSGHQSRAAVHTFDLSSGELVRSATERIFGGFYSHLVLPLDQADIALIYSDRIRSLTPADHAIGLPLIVSDFCMSPFFDSFDDPASGWPIADTGNVLYRYIDGEYNIHLRQGNTWAAAIRGDWWEEETEMRISGRVAESEGMWGIIYGLKQDWSEFYAFEIWPYDQIWTLTRYNNKTGWSLLGWGISSVIQPNNQVNTLSIRGSWDMRLQINGITFHYLNHVPGYIGLTGGSFDTLADIRYDDYLFVPEGCPTIPAAGFHQQWDSFIEIERPLLEELLLIQE
jgi:hypothetical protein